MDVTVILVNSALLQIAVASLALWLMYLAGKRPFWVLVAVAFLLLAAQRCLILARQVTGDLANRPDPTAESVALVASLFLLAGMVWNIYRLLSSRDSETNRRKGESVYHIFEDSPIPAWVEDLSEVKKYLDRLKNSGVKDLKAHFNSHLEDLAACVALVRVVEANRAALDLYKAEDKETFQKAWDMISNDITDASAFIEELVTVAEGRTNMSGETLQQALDGEQKCTSVAWFALPGYEETYSRVLILAIDITGRMRSEEELQQRNRELAMLNRVGEAFLSTLELDQVLTVALEEVRDLLGATASSAWLVDDRTGEMVCRQVTNPKRDTVLGWRLPPGEGIVGWVVREGKSLIVPDTRADTRHFKQVDRQIGLEMRSILSVPLRVRERVIGALQVVDMRVNYFDLTDLMLVEPLAATAAIAVENARLYEQARRDAETKSALLQEVNHRVKNNLAAIIGLLHAERRYIGEAEQSTYQSILGDLSNRVRGLATVHSLLSASEWEPLLLSDLTARVIHSSLRALPRDKNVSVEVLPSPVRVTPDQAHNLALVINELATNTAKHALQGRDEAHITVQITCDADTILFDFRDDGPGYPEEMLRQEHHSVGFDLVQEIVRKSLRGELTLYNDRGVVIRIQFKRVV